MCAHLPPEMGCLTHVHDYANDERATAWQRKNSTTHKRTTSPQPLVQPAPRRPTDSPQMWGNARMPAKRGSVASGRATKRRRKGGPAPQRINPSCPTRPGGVSPGRKA
ncbi:unnamed protein product [Prorocentrum cordatum]|uniref:Uncharacterized protein n=1 Tax=Prorocentrum cordatum TaxID=2364126 RepID=A0ABN9XN79_9DINO|nr:unnamed protein product [Polarella glacialis]